MIKRNPKSMKPSASRRDWSIREHTTHHACKEVMDRDGGKAVGCCCTGHNCKPIRMGQDLGSPDGDVTVTTIIENDGTIRVLDIESNTQFKTKNENKKNL